MPCTGTGRPVNRGGRQSRQNRHIEGSPGGTNQYLDYDQVPAAIFTSPEGAKMGLAEEEAKKRYGACARRALWMKDVPKARAVNDTKGLIKMVINPESGKVPGCSSPGFPGDRDHSRSHPDLYILRSCKEDAQEDKERSTTGSNLLIFMAPPPGLEPGTQGLGIPCSVRSELRGLWILGFCFGLDVHINVHPSDFLPHQGL